MKADFSIGDLVIDGCNNEVCLIIAIHNQWRLTAQLLMKNHIYWCEVTHLEILNYDNQ